MEWHYIADGETGTQSIPVESAEPGNSCGRMAWAVMGIDSAVGDGGPAAHHNGDIRWAIIVLGNMCPLLTWTLVT